MNKSDIFGPFLIIVYLRMYFILIRDHHEYFVFTLFRIDLLNAHPLIMQFSKQIYFRFILITIIHNIVKLHYSTTKLTFEGGQVLHGKCGVRRR